MTRRPAMDEHRRLEQLTRTKALDLLSSVNLGRLVFTHQALPAIRPVNHLVECESIIVRATAGAAIISAANTHGVSVAYAAESIHSGKHLGWGGDRVGNARLPTHERAPSHDRPNLPPP